MADNMLRFRARLQNLSRKHAAMSGGFTTHLRKDGLVVVEPKRAGRSIGLPIRPLMIVALTVMVFKAYALASLGPADYQARLDRLALGTKLEQTGAWVMSIDPVTAIVASQLSRFVG